MFSSLVNTIFKSKDNNNNNETKMCDYNLNTYFNFEKIDDLDYLNEKHLKLVCYKDYKIIKYNKEYLNEENVEELGLFRSVVFKNNKLIGFSPPKSLKNVEEKEGLVFEEYVEGTMINLVYDGEEWIITTRSNIGGNNNFYKGSKSFRYMFLEAMNSYDELSFDKLNKEHSYSFVLQHPHNSFVLQLTEPKLYLTSVYKCNEDYTVNIINKEDEEISSIVSKPTVYNVSSLEEAISKYACDSTIHFIQGVIIYDGIRRYKLRNPNYEVVRKLRGNQPKIQYQYYVLRQSNKVNEFLKHYPTYSKEFSELRNGVHEFTRELHKNYMDCFIFKNDKLKNYDGKYKQHMYRLHKKFIEELVKEGLKVTKNVVIEYVNNLEPAELMFSINYDYHIHSSSSESSSVSE
jgi:hypothetical protein